MAQIFSRFKNPKRHGAQLLKNAGYVEFGQFQPSVLHDEKAGGVKGYFCANCEYFKQQEGTLYGHVCTRLQNAEVADWGCCNLWHFLPPEKEAPAPGEVPEEPEQEPAQPAQAGQAATEKPQQQAAPEAPAEPQTEPAAEPEPEAPVAQKPAAKAVKPVPKPAPEEPEPEEPEEEPEDDEELEEAKRRLRKKIRSVIRQELTEILRAQKGLKRV